MTYKRIIAALDRTVLSQVVLENALKIAQENKANLMLFHSLLIDPQGVSPYTDIYGKELVNFSQAIQNNIEQEIGEMNEWLNLNAQKAIEMGISTEWNWQIGDAGSSICKLASSWNADLIIIGRRGRQGLAEIFLGSVSNYVVHHAPCSVLVIQNL